jgi:gamma-tubulin complex component 2
MTQPSRLDDPEIRAVLEANRAKIAMMQAQKQAQEQATAAAAAAGTINAANNPSSVDGVVGVASVGLPKVAAVGTTATTSGNLRSNPVFSIEEMMGPTPGPRISGEYAPKLAGVLRTPPISGIASDAGLPPVGDLFSPQPALPLGLSLGPSSSSSLTPQRRPHSAGSSSMVSDEYDPIPHFAAWDSTRPYLSSQFLFNHAADLAAGQASAAPAQPLESYPPQVQESMLVDDLLHAFGGFEGTWIRPKVVDGRNGPRLDFRIVARGQLEPALLEMATRMLPLCECVAVVSRYVETRRRYEWGVVCQALAGAMRGVLQDWDLMIAQLEHQLRGGKLTLQALWYYVQPPMAALRLVATIAAEASPRRLRGAGLLSLLHNKVGALMGDADAHKLALRLLRAAAEPYFSMLEKWLTQGIVDDPYSEFMIQENFEINKSELSGDGGAAFWSERFVLRAALDPLTGAPMMKARFSSVFGGGGSGNTASVSSMNDSLLGSGSSGGGINSSSTATTGPAFDVPAFLERAQKAILDTGRCLNLTRTCSSSGVTGHQQQQLERTLPAGVRLEYDEGGRFLLHVEHAHKAAAAAALSLMRHEVGVSRGLAAIKRYFLAAQGDLFIGLMESGDADLNSVCGTVPLQQLQSVLDIAVRCSSAATDPAAARLKAAYDHRSVLNLLIAITQTAGPMAATDSPTKRPKLRPVVPTSMTAAEKSTVGRQRRARESFMLSYEVPWPLSIVVPDSAMAQYQMIFRHLFELKWVEKELNRVCTLYQTTRPLAIAQRRSAATLNSGRRTSTSTGSEVPLSAAYAAAALSAAAPPPVANQALIRAYRTCQLMTHFFRQYLLYATFEVLEPLWHALEGHIESAGSVDEIVEFHKVFLRRVMKGLLLSRKVVVLRSLLSLKQTALDFVALSCRHVDLNLSVFDGEGQSSAGGDGASSSRVGSASGTSGTGSSAVSKKEAAAAAKRAKRLEKESQIKSALNEALSNPEFSAGLNDYRVKFEARCRDFMSALAEAHRQARSERTDTREELEGLLNLMGRLDFNGYFARAGLGGVALAEEGFR